eukprot:372243-Hanusia_phi.AAC.2
MSGRAGSDTGSTGAPLPRSSSAGEASELVAWTRRMSLRLQAGRRHEQACDQAEKGGMAGAEPELKVSVQVGGAGLACICLLYTSPSPRDRTRS